VLTLSSAHLIVTLACQKASGPLPRAPGPFAGLHRPHPLSQPSSPATGETPEPTAATATGVRGATPAQDTGTQAPRTPRQSLLARLTVSGDPSQQAPSPVRLSALGHTLLTGSIFLCSCLAFAIAMTTMERTVHRWDLCNHAEGSLLLRASPSTRTRLWRDAEKAANDAIAKLSVASPAQRARLLEQRHEIVGLMDSYCLISHDFQIQFTAFTMVGTAAAILVTISLASVAPDGLKTSNRTLLNVLMTSSIILAICVVYPQSFSQKNNQDVARITYLQAAGLMRTFSSSIANLEIPKDGNNSTVFTPMKSPDQIALFIRMVDASLEQLNSSRLSFNNNFASSTFNQLSAPSGAPQPNPTAGPLPDSPAGPALPTP
jgi:hypothetical protein